MCQFNPCLFLDICPVRQVAAADSAGISTPLPQSKLCFILNTKGHVYAHNRCAREAVCSPDTPASFLWLLRNADVELTGTFPKSSDFLGTKSGHWQEIKATHGGNRICFHLMSKLSLRNEPWKRLNLNKLSFPQVPASLFLNQLGDIKILFSISL